MTPLWILCNPRSGSSLLCDLLNSTGKFPPLVHDRLVDRRGPLERGLAFNEWLRLFFEPYGVADFERTPIPHTKCIHHQFVEVFGDRDAAYVEKHVPGVRFVWLHRKGVYEQTASLYFAKKLFDRFQGNAGRSSSYHIYHRQDLDQYLNTTVEFDAEAAKAAHAEVASYERNWDTFLGGREPLRVYYEDLMTSPGDQVRRVLEYCDIPVDDAEIKDALARLKETPRIHMMTRPEQGWFIKRLKATLAPIHL